MEKPKWTFWPTQQIVYAFTIISQEPLATMQGQDITERILEQESGAKIPTTSMVTKTDCIRNVKIATCWLHCHSPKLAQNHAEKSPPSLQFLHWEKRAPGTHSAPLPLWVTSWKLESQPIGIEGKSAGLNHWKSDHNEEAERGWQQPALRSWQTQIYLQNPSKNPNHKVCLSAEPNSWCTVTREL